MDTNYNKFSIEKSKTLIDALELMDNSGHKLLIVIKVNYIIYQ